MPIINGGYYMNPQYGAALERARMLADASPEDDSFWSEPAAELLGTREQHAEHETRHLARTAAADNWFGIGLGREPARKTRPISRIANCAVPVRD